MRLSLIDIFDNSAAKVISAVFNSGEHVDSRRVF